MTLLALVFQLFRVSSALAGTELDGVAAGATFSTVIGKEHQKYSEPVGARVQLWAKNDAVLGNAFLLHGSANYKKHDLNGLPAEIGLTQWGFFLGLQTGHRSNPNWLKPFFGVDLGMVFSDLKSPAGYAKNSSFHFATEVNPGFEIPIWGALSFQAALPLTIIFTTETFYSLAGEASLRWAL